MTTDFNITCAEFEVAKDSSHLPLLAAKLNSRFRQWTFEEFSQFKDFAQQPAGMTLVLLICRKTR